MTGRKIYLQPSGMLIQAICDLEELQKGKYTYSDSQSGVIHFRVRLYHNKWEFKFAVKDLGNSRSSVELALDGREKRAERMIDREFALLDSMLTIGAEIDLEDSEDYAT